MSTELGPLPDAWSPLCIALARGPDGTLGGHMTIGDARYHVRSWHRCDDGVQAQVQEFRDPRWEEYLAELDVRARSL